jgi:hypothetical protein
MSSADTLSLMLTDSHIRTDLSTIRMNVGSSWQGMIYRPFRPPLKTSMVSMRGMQISFSPTPSTISWRWRFPR